MEVVKDDAYTSSLDESPVLVFITAVFINKIHKYGLISLIGGLISLIGGQKSAITVHG